jgi:eukaryotic-like serine/threonine-protein kinase
VLHVESLSAAEAADLALRLLGENGEGQGAAVEALSETLAAAIARESAGNPFFVHELVRYHRGEASGAASAAEPVTLEAVLTSRIERLTEPGRRLLEIIAVAGRPVGQIEAFRAAATGSEERTALASLLAARLIRTSRREDRSEIEIYHDRIRETITARLPAATRQAHHRDLALALEAFGADAEFLAEHWEAAQAVDRAAHYYALAADRAAEALAFERAVRLYRLALQGPPADGATRRTLQVQLGDALANAGRGAEAAETYLQAADGAPSTESRDLMRRAGFQYCISGHLDQGRAAFRRILGEIGLRLPSTRYGTFAALLYFRAKLRLRGLRFELRSGAVLPEQERMRLDITESVAMGCSTNSPWHGALFQTRNLLLALRSGDPVRIALALSWEAAYNSLVGQPGWHRTRRLLGLAQSLAAETQHPHALGSASLALGTAEFLRGRYGAALEHNGHAERIFRDHCTGVIWEQDTAQIFGLWSLFYMGRIGELRARYASVFEEARQRGDRYLMTTLGTQVGTLLLLADDEPQAAREALDDLMSRWTHDGFTVQHHNEFFARQAIDLYQGRIESALARFARVEPLYRSALLLRIQHIRTDLWQLKARCCLAAATRDADRRGDALSRVAKCIRNLRNDPLPCGTALAALLEADRHAVDGRTDAAVAGWRLAGEELLRADMVLAARVADWQRGRCLAGSEGAALAEAAWEWFRQQQVRHPERLVRMISPVFPG